VRFVRCFACRQNRGACPPRPSTPASPAIPHPARVTEMHKLMLPMLLALLLPATAAASLGSGPQGFRPDKGLDLEAPFSEQRAAINKALGDGETYSEIQPDDVLAVQQALARMASLLGGAETADKLDPETR